MSSPHTGRATTGDTALDPTEIRRQLERICQSKLFHNAESLRKFLTYVTLAALEGREDELKESVIGVNVLNRPSDFDSRSDNGVRVQAHRLRARLQRYYAGPGAGDPIRIRIPKGHYIPVFERQRPAVAATEGREAGPWRRRLAAAALTGILLGAAGAWAMHGFWPPARSEPQSVSAELDRLWAEFLDDPERPVLIAYANHVFVESPEGVRLRYSGSAVGLTGTPARVPPEDIAAPPDVRIGGPLAFHQNSTGYGEVEATQLLTRMFTGAGVPTRIKRSRLLLLDDLRRSHLIILGSAMVNAKLEELMRDLNFVFDRDAEGRVVIHNRRPRGDEPALFRGETDPESGARIADHALVSFFPGPSGDRIAVLGGCWTEGTLAAARFAASTDAAAALQRELEADGGDVTGCFEALVRTPILQGEVGEPSLVTARSTPCTAPTRRVASRAAVDR